MTAGALRAASTAVDSAGSVIVADTNGCFFELAVRRNYVARVTVNARF